MAKLGRPSIYTEELADEICAKLASQSRGIQHLCRTIDHFPSEDTIYEWRRTKPIFSEKYDKAKADQVMYLVDEIVEIADDVSNDKVINDNGKEVCNNEAVNRSRLRVETRKWIAARLAPKIYGQKTQTEVTISYNDEQVLAWEAAKAKIHTDDDTNGNE